MRLRTANKILAAVGTPRQSAYSDAQIGRALARYERTRSAKEANRLFAHLMGVLGVNGRVRLLARGGAWGKAFDLYMREGD